MSSRRREPPQAESSGTAPEPERDPAELDAQSAAEPLEAINASDPPAANRSYFSELMGNLEELYGGEGFVEFNLLPYILADPTNTTARGVSTGEPSTRAATGPQPTQRGQRQVRSILRERHRTGAIARERQRARATGRGTPLQRYQIALAELRRRQEAARACQATATDLQGVGEGAEPGQTSREAPVTARLIASTSRPRGLLTGQQDPSRSIQTPTDHQEVAQSLGESSSTTNAFAANQPNMSVVQESAQTPQQTRPPERIATWSLLRFGQTEFFNETAVRTFSQDEVVDMRNRGEISDSDFCMAFGEMFGPQHPLLDKLDPNRPDVTKNFDFLGGTIDRAVARTLAALASQNQGQKQLAAQKEVQVAPSHVVGDSQQESSETTHDESGRTRSQTRGDAANRARDNEKEKGEGEGKEEEAGL